MAGSEVAIANTYFNIRTPLSYSRKTERVHWNSLPSTIAGRMAPVFMSKRPIHASESRAGGVAILMRIMYSSRALQMRCIRWKTSFITSSFDGNNIEIFLSQAFTAAACLTVVGVRSLTIFLSTRHSPHSNLNSTVSKQSTLSNMVPRKDSSRALRLVTTWDRCSRRPLPLSFPKERDPRLASIRNVSLKNARLARNGSLVTNSTRSIVNLVDPENRPPLSVNTIT